MTAEQTNKLQRLRLSNVETDEFVLMDSINRMIPVMQKIKELNLSCINIHGRQFADLMQSIKENCNNI